MRPYACTIQLYGLGLESTLDGFMKGGTGFLQMKSNRQRKVKMEGHFGMVSIQMS